MHMKTKADNTDTPVMPGPRADRIADWDETDRPRERLMRLGPAALSPAELLAILIGSGSLGESAVALMRRVLKDCGNSLNALGKRSIDELCQYKGLGSAKAITILAACELGKRRQREDIGERRRISRSRDIYEYFHSRLQDEHVEECHVLLLNQQLCPIGSKCVGRGGITGTVVDLRLVLREALLGHAVAIALCHNHPSGNPRPSREDDELTQRLAKAAATMDIRLIDHIVLTDGNYYSYSDEGRL